MQQNPDDNCGGLTAKSKILNLQLNRIIQYSYYRLQAPMDTPLSARE